MLMPMIPPPSGADTTPPVEQSASLQGSVATATFIEADSLPVDVYWSSYDQGATNPSAEVKAGTGAYESGSYLNQTEGTVLQSDILTSSTPAGNRQLAVVVEDNAGNLQATPTRINFPQGGTVYPTVNMAGDFYVTTTDQIADNAQFLLHFGGVLRSTGRDALVTWDNTAFHLAAFDNYLYRAWFKTSTGTQATGPLYQQAAADEYVHILIRGYESGGNMISEMEMWRAGTGTWNSQVSNSVAGTLWGFTSQAASPLTWFQRNNSGNLNRFWNGDIQRLAMWTGVSPDISQASVRNNFENGAAIADPSLAVSAYGTPVFDWRGNAAAYNTPNQQGSLSNSNMTTVGGPVTDA